MKKLVIAVYGDNVPMHEDTLKSVIEKIEENGTQVYRAWIEPVTVQTVDDTLNGVHKVR